MSFNKVVYIVKSELHYYPPCISQIRMLNKLGIDIQVLYGTSNESAIELLKKENIKCKKINGLKITNTNSKIGKLFNWYKYRKAMLKELKKMNTDNTIFWFGTAESVLPLKGKLDNVNYIVSFLELLDESKIKQMLLKDIAQKAKAITVCEQTRGYIMQNWWKLKKTPYVFPNKPYDQLRTKKVIPTNNVTKKIIEDIGNKEFILYQGIIQNTEELIELARALKKMNKGYFLVLMGIDKYNSVKKIQDIYEKTIFIDYIPAPLHLEITSYARIGIAFYRPDSLNKIFCAPNKIYEYSGFGIPMICNKVPGLSNTVGVTGAAICIELCEEEIIKAINSIEQNYEKFSQNAINFFEKEDTIKTMEKLIKKVGIIGEK